MLSIGMTTAPRKRSTINKSIRSLRQAGFKETIHIFCEPMEVEVMDDNVIIHMNESTKGCFFNWRDGLSYLMHETDGDYFLMLQDDVVYKKNIYDSVMKTAKGIKDLGFLSLYLAKHDSDVVEKNRAGVYQHKLKCQWGALTYLMDRDGAWKLMNHPKYQNHFHSKKLDCVVCQCMIELNLSMNVIYPSMASHVGYHSTVGHVPLEEHKGFGFSR